MIPILSLTFTIVITTKLFMEMAMMRTDYEVKGETPTNSTHKVTTERATITLISFQGLLQQRVRIQKGTRYQGDLSRPQISSDFWGFAEEDGMSYREEMSVDRVSSSPFRSPHQT